MMNAKAQAEEARMGTDASAPAIEPSIDSIKDDEFAATGGVEGGRMTLRFWGNADLRVKDRLDVFLREVDRRSMDTHADEVVVDLRRLDFMNSCCLKALVTWLGKVQERPSEEQYRVLFMKDPAAHWQARSLHALVAFAPGMIRIE